MTNKDLFKRFMCGMMSVAMIASANTAVLAAATKTDIIITSAQTEKTYIQLEAVVVEVISSNSIMVDWFDSTYGRTIVYCDNMPNVSDGDKVFVISDGNFMESYPMQLNANKVFVFTETVTAFSNNEDIEDFLAQTEANTTYSDLPQLTNDCVWPVDGVESTPTVVNTTYSDLPRLTDNCVWPVADYEIKMARITEIDWTSNRMQLSSGHILDCIDGAEVDKYVELALTFNAIYVVRLWAEEYHITLSREEMAIISPEESLATYSELNPDKEQSSYPDDVTEPTSPSSNYDEETWETTTTAFEHCEPTPDIGNMQARGIVIEITDSGYVVEVGSLLITVEKELLIDSEEVDVGDIIGFYGRYCMSIDDPNPLNWGQNTEIMKITLGDADEDGGVGLLDIIEVNKHIVGSTLVSTRGKLSADIDNNGRITAADNMSIAMYLCKKITNLNDLLEEVPEETTVTTTAVENGTTSVYEYDYKYPRAGVAEVLEVNDDNTVIISINGSINLTAHYGDELQLSVGDIVNAYNTGGYITWEDFQSNYEIISKRILGDANLDGEVNELDIELIKSYIEHGKDKILESLLNSEWSNADVNNDFKINDEDIVLIEKYISGEITILEDRDHSGFIPMKGTLRTHVVEVIDANDIIVGGINNETFHVILNDMPELSVGDTVDITYIGGDLSKGIFISIQKIIRGDINQDGVIDDLDVQYIKQNIEEGYSFDWARLAYGDVNFDNEITIDDAIIIEKYLAGEISSFDEEIRTTPVETNEPAITSIELLTSIAIVTITTEEYFYVGEGARVAEVLEIIDDNTARVFIYTLKEGIAYYGDGINLSVGDSVNVYSPDGYVTWEEYCNSFEIISKRILGDANLDGEINELDIELINSYIEQGARTIFTNLINGKWVNADVNNDFEIDDADISIIKKYIAGEISSIDDMDHEIYLPILNFVYAQVIEVIDANNFTILLEDGPCQITFSNNPELSSGDMVILEWGGMDGPIEKRMVSVTKVILGDANMDGKLNDLDAKYIRSTIASGKYFIFDQVFYADVNFDNEVTIDDAIIIEKYLAGEITSFDKK